MIRVMMPRMVFFACGDECVHDVVGGGGVGGGGGVAFGDGNRGDGVGGGCGKLGVICYL